ncbi:MAG: hypothetical protein IBX50_08505 [Marinospirillum sp.]|uniref:hypothetical protein n=1 Tax=Marinospirillum sp. TaxID=2183934 RepID=UPI001A002F64|nr:hypothetical protein [Marinospirillum sp.]MBE0506747.1 hypothetical protein [Marinospirillum sp.]
MPKATYRDCFNQQEIDQLAAIGTSVNDGSFVYDDHKIFLSECAKKALKKQIGEKPQLLFLGSLQHNLSDIIQDATQARGMGQFIFLSSEALFRHAIDEAWGAGSFKYIKWSNSKSSLNKSYSGSVSSKETIEIFFGKNDYSKHALEDFCEYLAGNQGSVNGFAMHFQQDIIRPLEHLPNGAFDIPAAPSLSSFKEFDTMSNNTPSPEQLKIKANLKIVYDLAAVFESEDDVRKQIEHYLKAGVEQLIGCGMITGALPVCLDEHDIQVDISETLTGLDEKNLHCNLILDASFSIDEEEAEADRQTLSGYANELSENMESIFSHMSAEGMMSGFSDTLIVDDLKVTIDYGQPDPNKPVQRDELSM